MHLETISCILFVFYIKPQPSAPLYSYDDGCILFVFYIKPQLLYLASSVNGVVSYSCSTSNHNFINQ